MGVDFPRHLHLPCTPCALLGIVQKRHDSRPVRSSGAVQHTWMSCHRRQCHAHELVDRDCVYSLISCWAAVELVCSVCSCFAFGSHTVRFSISSCTVHRLATQGSVLHSIRGKWVVCNDHSVTVTNLEIRQRRGNGAEVW